MGKRELAGQAVVKVLSLFSERAQEATVRYRQFVADGVEMGKCEDLGSSRKKPMLNVEEDNPYDARILGDGEFVKKLLCRQELEAKMWHPMEINDIVAQTCTRFGIIPEELQLNCRKAKTVEARSVICYLAVRLLGHNGAAVGNQINLQRAEVSVAAMRGARMVLNDPTLLELVDR
jgi:putative transposase